MPQNLEQYVTKSAELHTSVTSAQLSSVRVSTHAGVVVESAAGAAVVVGSAGPVVGAPVVVGAGVVTGTVEGGSVESMTVVVTGGRVVATVVMASTAHSVGQVMRGQTEAKTERSSPANMAQVKPPACVVAAWVGAAVGAWVVTATVVITGAAVVVARAPFKVVTQASLAQQPTRQW